MAITFNDEGIYEGKITKDELLTELKTNLWREALPKEVATHASTATFTTMDDFANAYLNKDKLVGRKGLIIPKEGDTPEVYNEFYKAIGVPQDIKEYDTIKDMDNLPDVVKNTSKEDRQHLIKWANENKIPKQDAEKFLQYFQSTLSEGYNKIKSNEENQKTINAEALQKEWGGETDSKLKIVNDFLNSKDPDGKLEKYKNDNLFIKFVDSIASDYKEDSLKNNSFTRQNITPLEAQSKRNKFMEDNKDIIKNKRHPRHKDVMAEYDIITAQAFQK